MFQTEMAGPNELLNFVTKFRNLWYAGKKASLRVECEAEEASVNLHVYLGTHPSPHQLGTGRRKPPSRPGPSRCRRSARRAEARAGAAAKAANCATTAAVKVAEPISPAIDAAVQVAVPFPPTVDAAVQAAAVPPPTANAAVQACPSPLPALAEQEQTHQLLQYPSHHRRAAVQAVQHLPLATCQGQVSLGIPIPQLDGATSSNKCDNCNVDFETSNQLQHHNETYQFGCEECFICFTSKFYADLHELEKHPGTTYARDHIPNSTKLMFASRLH